MRIDKKKYLISEDCRYKTQNVKSQIIIGFSLRKDNYHIIHSQNKDYHKTKKWNTYTISRDGSIFEHYNPKYHTDFLGIKEADKKSISILIENMGGLFKTPDDTYINWLNETCDIKNVVEKKWLGYNYWENISNIQMDNCAKLCGKLCDEFNIPKKIIDFHYYNKDVLKYKGILFRSNYIEDSSDANPIFNIPKFNQILNKL